MVWYYHHDHQYHHYHQRNQSNVLNQHHSFHTHTHKHCVPSICIYVKSTWVVVSNIVFFHPYLGKWSNLTIYNMFQLGWNHQPFVSFTFTHPKTNSTWKHYLFGRIDFERGNHYPDIQCMAYWCIFTYIYHKKINQIYSNIPCMEYLGGFQVPAVSLYARWGISTCPSTWTSECGSSCHLASQKPSTNWNLVSVTYRIYVCACTCIYIYNYIYI